MYPISRDFISSQSFGLFVGIRVQCRGRLIVGGKESRRIGRISSFAAESSQKAVPVLFVFVLFFPLSRSLTALLFSFFVFCLIATTRLTKLYFPCASPGVPV